MDRFRSVRVTPPDDSPADRPHHVRRHTVRIVQRRTLPRVAVLSLVMTIAAAAIAFTAWRWWQPAPTVPVYQRTLGDVEMSWKCEAGHSFTAPGQVADRPCAMCDQPAYPVVTYECKQHGAVDVAVRFTAGSDGAPRMSQLRVNQGSWFSADDPVLCPQCGTRMVRKQADPLDALNRNKKKGG